MFQLPTSDEIFLAKIIKIQRRILKLQLKMSGILSMRHSVEEIELRVAQL